eukprot:COSAG02_NODE_5600_length_4198_cov_8.658858_1_plen_33_part_00
MRGEMTGEGGDDGAAAARARGGGECPRANGDM